MQNIISTIFKAQLENFAKEFVNTSKTVFYDHKNKKLIHPGEFGMLRESCIRNFLSNFFPDQYGIGQGYVIGQNDEISHQCDIIIYHKSYTPYFHTPEHQRFFPIESVIAAGEVKSKITGEKLDDSLKKLTKIKQMRESITNATIAYCRPNVTRKFDPVNDIRDQLVTFLIGEEFVCSDDVLAGRIKKSWDNSFPRHRVNLTTAINSGTCLYKDVTGISFWYPIEPNGNELPIRLITPLQDSYGHLAIFIHYLSMLIENCTVLFPEMAKHFSPLFKMNIKDL